MFSFRGEGFGGCGLPFEKCIQVKVMGWIGLRIAQSHLEARAGYWLASFSDPPVSVLSYCTELFKWVLGSKLSSQSSCCRPFTNWTILPAKVSSFLYLPGRCLKSALSTNSRKVAPGKLQVRGRQSQGGSPGPSFFSMCSSEGELCKSLTVIFRLTHFQVES